MFSQGCEDSGQCLSAFNRLEIRLLLECTMDVSLNLFFVTAGNRLFLNLLIGFLRALEINLKICSCLNKR